MSATSSWTEDRVRSLRTLWSEGLSASQIARRLAGGVTRNAVIGKIHRLGLARRAPPSRPGQRRTERPYRALTRPPRHVAAVTSLGLSMPVQEELGAATVLTIGTHACRWPIGDPLEAGFSLCGRPASRGAYCDGHGAVAYRRPEKTHLLKLAGLA